jgi:hypothetical protein
VVDRDSGSITPPALVLGNLARLGITAVPAGSGSECVPEFVATKLEEAIEVLPSATEFGDVRPNSDVVAAISKGWSGSGSGALYVLAWNANEQCFDAHGVLSGYMRGSTTPYRESILNSMAPGYRNLEDFVTVERLQRHIDGGKPFIFKHPDSGALAVGIGIERLKVERWELLELKWAPYSQSG